MVLFKRANAERHGFYRLIIISPHTVILLFLYLKLEYFKVLASRIFVLGYIYLYVICYLHLYYFFD